MLRNLLLGTAVATFAAFGAANAAPFLTIDTFETPLTVPFLAVTSAAPNAQDTSSGPGIIGNSRELFLTHTGGGSVITADITGGVFSHSNGATAEGTSLLRWDGTANGAAALDFGLTADLSQANLAVHISVLSADLTNGSITLTMYTSAGAFAVGDVNLPTGASEHFLLLSSLDVTGAFDLANVTAIELLAVGGSNFDVAMDIVEVVPEPLSMALLGVGLIGLAAVRRRKAT